MVDVACRHIRGGVASDGGTDARPKIIHANAEAPDLCPADCTLWFGGRRDLLVGRAVGHAALCDQSDREAARATGAILSFRALVARHVGFYRIFGFLHAADGNVLDRRFRSKARSQVRG